MAAHRNHGYRHVKMWERYAGREGMMQMDHHTPDCAVDIPLHFLRPY